MNLPPSPEPAHSPSAYIQALSAFVRAQRCADCLQMIHAANEVLIPSTFLPADLHDNTAYRPVAAILKTLGDRHAQHAMLLYEVWELAMTHALSRLGEGMPTLRREALYVAHGLQEPIHWEALGADAAGARQEAAEALYGSPPTWEPFPS